MEIRGGKRFRTKAERRAIVEETYQPGGSVSQVARRHDVNTNQVFTWRREYRAGRLDETANESAVLLPVRVTAATSGRSVERRKSNPSVAACGSIEIDLGHARVRIEGNADPECVRAVLEGLAR